MKKCIRPLIHTLTALAVTSGLLSVSIIPDNQSVVTLSQSANAQTACDRTIRNVSFSGTTSGSRTGKPNITTNVRSNTTTSASIVTTIPANTSLTFSGWAYGSPVTDLWTGKTDYRWFRVTRNVGGRNVTGWVASGVIYGNPPNSPLAPNCSPTTSGVRLPWQNGVTGQVSQTSHPDRWTGSIALDIAFLRNGQSVGGTPVLAPTDVTVVASCLARGTTSHRAMKLRDSAGRFYSLIHVSASSAAVTVGKTYRKGEQIGVVASDKPNDPNCAISTGPHLHMSLPSNPFSIGGYSLGSSTRLGTQLTAR